MYHRPWFPNTARCRSGCGRVLRGRPLVDVETHPDQDQWPQDGCQDGGDDRLQGVKVRPVMVRRGDDPAGDQVDDDEPADAGPRPRVRLRVTGHVSPSIRLYVLKPFRRPGGYAPHANLGP